MDSYRRLRLHRPLKEISRRVVAKMQRMMNPVFARRPARPGEDHPLIGYYVDKYVRKSYGTLSQLERGIRLTFPEEHTSVEILGRLLRSWRAMKMAHGGAPQAYQITGEWAFIVSHGFQPLLKALDDQDSVSLASVLEAFVHHFGDFVGEPTDFSSPTMKRYRCDLFRVWSSRWMDLYGEAALDDAKGPLLGRPIGFLLEQGLYTFATFFYNFYARRMADLCSDIQTPTICEIGGGFGAFAYHLLRRQGGSFRYLDYDIPPMAILAGYVLLSAFPDRRVMLFGEVETLGDPLKDADAAILPNFALPYLKERYADVGFNSCSFAEMERGTVEEYMRELARICRHYLLHVNHSWTPESGNAYYQPSGGFSHWNLSLVEPSATQFKRLHRIPAPFLSDFYGEFFEWLYSRKADS